MVGDGAEALKRIREIEEKLDRRYSTAEKEAREILARARSGAREIIERKKGELARANLLGAGSEADDDVGVAEKPPPFTGFTEDESRMVETMAEKLFAILVGRKSGETP